MVCLGIVCRTQASAVSTLPVWKYACKTASDISLRKGVMTPEKRYILSVLLLVISACALFSLHHFLTARDLLYLLEKERTHTTATVPGNGSEISASGAGSFQERRAAAERGISDIRNHLLVSTAMLVLALVSGMLLLRFIFFGRPLARVLGILQKAGRAGTPVRQDSISADGQDELLSAVRAVLSKMESLQAELDRRQVNEIAHMEKMASIGEVAATVAHEIKNPLAGISGALQVLAEEYPESSPRREIADDVLREIDRLDKSIKDLLSFARPPELHLILADIHAIIDKVTHALKAPAAERGVMICTKYGSVPEVPADPDQMEKALLNLGTHAIYAMGRGGTLTIATALREDTGEAEVLFSDTAGDIGEDRLRHIFKPTFSSRNLGAGFRLAISRNIIESHKGKIAAEPVPGVGTVFRVRIPLKR